MFSGAHIFYARLQFINNTKKGKTRCQLIMSCFYLCQISKNQDGAQEGI